jgi:hypothetical protein
MLYQVDLVSSRRANPSRHIYLCELRIGNGLIKTAYYHSREEMKGILIQKYEYIGTYGEYDHYKKVDDDESQG